MVSGRPLVSVVVAPSGFLQPPLRRDIDVAVQVVAALEVQVATFMIGHRSVPVDALVGAAAVVAGVLRSVVEFAAVAQARSVAVAAAGVDAPVAVAAVALPVAAAVVDAGVEVDTTTFGIGFAAPVVEATVGVDVATVAIGGDLAREATIDAVVEPIVAHAAVVAGAVSVPVRIDSVATCIVMAEPGVDVTVVVNASVAGVVSAPASGWVNIAVTTVQIVSRGAAVSVSPTVSVTAREVAYRTAVVSTTPTVSTTQQSVTFTPMGMEKDASTQTISSSTIADITGMVARPGYSGTVIVSNRLTPAAGAGVVRAQINTVNSGLNDYSAVLELVHNSTVLQSISTGTVAWLSGNRTWAFNAHNVTITAGDTLGVRARKSSSLGKSFLIAAGAGTYVTLDES